VGATDSLRNAIERTFPDRPFSIELWDGTKVPGTRPGATISFRSPRAFGHILRAPGELGLGRAYVCGDLDVDDIDAVVALLGRWQAPRLGAAAKARLGQAVLRAHGVHRLPDPPAAELRPRGAKHTKRRDAAAVRHHYDVSNEFFRLFLDESLTYSCAYFSGGAETLEEAQEAKLGMVCRKLGLEPGMRVLDIGCGWGSFAIHAAREHGVSALGITLSEPQAALARERVVDAALADKVEVRVMDYRDLGAERFDAVCSIGMFEHVGEANIDEYMRLIAGVLKPDAKVLNHGITHVGSETHIGGDFSERYVFPDGEILPLSRVILALERAGLEPVHVEGLHRDYAETLRHWAARLDQNLEEAERLGGAERLRVWRLYLRAARNGFETANTSVFQVLAGRPLSEPSRSEPATELSQERASMSAAQT